MLWGEPGCPAAGFWLQAIRLGKCSSGFAEVSAEKWGSVPREFAEVSAESAKVSQEFAEVSAGIGEVFLWELVRVFAGTGEGASENW